MDVILSQKKINNFPLIFCVILLLFASCKGKVEKPELARPNDLMGRDTMVHFTNRNASIGIITWN
jgi:hypothetical protein